MKVSEARAALNVCGETVRRYIARGQLAAFRLPGRHGEWRIPLEEIDRIKQAGTLGQSGDRSERA